MSDEVDLTNDRIAADVARDVGEICRKASSIPKGEPGECHYCGEEFARVVEVIDPVTEDKVCACGRCRDKRKL